MKWSTHWSTPLRKFGIYFINSLLLSTLEGNIGGWKAVFFKVGLMALGRSHCKLIRGLQKQLQNMGQRLQISPLKIFFSPIIEFWSQKKSYLEVSSQTYISKERAGTSDTGTCQDLQCWGQSTHCLPRVWTPAMWSIAAVKPGRNWLAPRRQLSLPIQLDLSFVVEIVLTM